MKSPSDIKPVLDPDAIYLGDGGRAFCGDCAGCSAKYTGRDLSGQAVYRCTKEDAEWAKKDGYPLRCEKCEKEVVS